MSDWDRPDRRGRIPTVNDDELRRAVKTRLQETDSLERNADSEDISPSASAGQIGSGPETPETSNTHPGLGEDTHTAVGSSNASATTEPDETTRPFIKITPAREQVTPGHIVKALYGLYRTGSGRQLPFGLERRLSFVRTHFSFEFLIHKPRHTQRFDFYLGQKSESDEEDRFEFKNCHYFR